MRIPFRFLGIFIFLVPLAADAQVGDATLGATLYHNNCEVCHGVAPNVAGGARLGANNPTVINNAIHGGVQPMSVLAFLTATDISNIAAYLGSVLIVDYTGAWYNASESGWGVSIIKGASGTLGVIIYDYDSSHAPSWYILAAGAWTSTTAFSGALFRFSGPAYNETFNPAQVTNAPVGNATLTFSSATTATINFTINNVQQARSIVKLSF